MLANLLRRIFGEQLRVHALQTLPPPQHQPRRRVPQRRHRCLPGTPLRQQRQRPHIAPVQREQQHRGLSRMRGPVHADQDELVVRLGNDSLEVQLRPIERRLGLRHGRLQRESPSR